MPYMFNFVSYQSLQTLLSCCFLLTHLRVDNNPCGVSHFGDADSAFNFADWDHWARTTSPNKDIKVYMGAVAATYAGINGTYVDSGTLASVIKSLKQYKSFGGVMLWDVSAAAGKPVGLFLGH
jgi:chitinase